LVGGIILYDGVQMGGEGDELAAFDNNGNVRGVAIDIGTNLDFGPYAGTAIWEMTMRSNNNGDLISFQYYDASEDVILEASTVYTFVTNDQLGDVFNPYEIIISSSVDLSIELTSGYNWISFNVIPEDLSLATILSSVGESANFISSQSSGTATNYGAYGWYGGLESLEPTQMYKIEMSEPATLIITGLPVDVTETAIELITGWNWIGYLPQNLGSVGEALESVSENAEFISSQSSGTATNYGAYGWYGSLEMLEPGNGYLLDMDSPGTLLYPEFNSLTRSFESKHEIILSDNLSNWEFNYSEYEFLGTVHISIDNDQASDNDLVGAFVNEECRGLAERIYFPFDDSYMFILQVYSNDLSGEEVTFL
jgi:hypothetical protein